LAILLKHLNYRNALTNYIFFDFAVMADFLDEQYMGEEEEEQQQEEDEAAVQAGADMAGGDMSGYEHCIFLRVDYAGARFHRLRKKKIVPARGISWAALRECRGAEAIARQWIPEGSPLDRFFDDFCAPSHRPLVIEFLSTFRFRPPGAGSSDAGSSGAGSSGRPPRDIEFSILGVEYGYSLDEWATHIRWYTRDDLVEVLILFLFLFLLFLFLFLFEMLMLMLMFRMSTLGR
jgi:hypothetical protein